MPYFKLHLPFILLMLSAIAWLVCVPLFQDGMFMDGVLYASVSKNLSQEIGSFWFPVFSEKSVAGLDTFHEHPPLVFFLQSLFFRLIGDNIYPERVYCMVMLVLTAFFIILIWRKIFSENKNIRMLWWLPVLLWIIMPVVFWAFTNNVQENTMVFFTIAAIYFLLNSTDKPNIFVDRNFYMAGVCIFLAGFSKGVPGLFPLVFFVLHWLVFKKISFTKSIIYSISLILFVSAIYSLLLLHQPARESLSTWFYDRMIFRIDNNPVVGSRFSILERLFTEQLPAILFCVAAYLIFRWRIIKNDFSRKQFLLFFLIGLSASLPLMLTLIQRGFYITPSLPFFAIAWAMVIAGGVAVLINRIDTNSIAFKTFRFLSALVLVAGIAFTYHKAGDIKRNKELLQDVHALSKIIEPNTTVCTSHGMIWNNWQFRTYMMRYASVSLTSSDTCLYIIYGKQEAPHTGYSETEYELNEMKLSMRNEVGL